MKGSGSERVDSSLRVYQYIASDTLRQAVVEVTDWWMDSNVVYDVFVF